MLSFVAEWDVDSFGITIFVVFGVGVGEIGGRTGIDFLGVVLEVAAAVAQGGGQGFGSLGEW